MFVTAAIDLTAVLPFAIFGLFAAAAGERAAAQVGDEGGVADDYGNIIRMGFR